MQYRDFIEQQIAKLRACAADREAEGASTAPVYARIATELEEAHEAFLHTPLSPGEAVKYSNFSPAFIAKWRLTGKPRTREHLPFRPVARKPRMKRSNRERAASQRIRKAS